MPSIENPAYYERASYISAGHADEFLKWLDEDQYEMYTGSTDSPIGWVGLIKIDADLIREWVSSSGDPWMSEHRNFAPGWYIVRQDDNGFVWGLGYEGWCLSHGAFCADTASEQDARADFAEAEAAYQVWLGETDEVE